MNQYGPLVNNMYQQMLGRNPDQAGANFWQGVASQWQHGNTQRPSPSMVNFMRQAAQNQPDDRVAFEQWERGPAMNLLTPQRNTMWDDYMARASAQARGLNSMPYVYNYQGDIYQNDEQLEGTYEGIIGRLKRLGGLGGLGGLSSNDASTKGNPYHAEQEAKRKRREEMKS